MAFEVIVNQVAERRRCSHSNTCCFWAKLRVAFELTDLADLTALIVVVAHVTLSLLDRSSCSMLASRMHACGIHSDLHMRAGGILRCIAVGELWMGFTS
jgi:hypothetical protein